MSMQLNEKRVINGWAFFDWANSAYYLVISTAIFPIYYSNVTDASIQIGGGTISNAALYSFTVSAAYILIAIMSPLLSGIADYSGRRMFFLRLFTMLGIAGCLALFFFESQASIWLGLSAFMIGTIGAAGGLVFYDSYLPVIASEDQYDKVSAKGYAYGYFGSVLLLIVCLVIIQKPDLVGITNPTLPARISFVLVGIWWLGFSQITFNRLPKDNRTAMSGNLFRHGWKELLHVWENIRHDKDIKLYLGAYFFYIAGVHTVIYLATLFASKELGFKDAELIITVLLLQLVAIPGALFFAFISRKKGNKWSLMIQLFLWIIICCGAYATTEKWQFFSIAALVGMVLGGIQSLSRSTYAKLIENRSKDLTSFFSFYDILSKLGIVSGTLIFGVVNSVTGNMRYSVLCLALLFLIGLLLLNAVNKNRINPGQIPDEVIIPD